MTMLLIVSQGVLRVGVFRVLGKGWALMRMMMMTRMPLGCTAIGGGLLLVPAVFHLVPLTLLLLGPWVPPCFRRFLTVSISYRCKTRRFAATSRTWPTCFITPTRTTSGLTLLPIDDLPVPLVLTD